MVLRTVFRLATINVHGFKNAQNKNNINDLISIIKPFHIDLLAVEEINKTNGWQRFCQELCLNYFLFEPSYGDYYGNGFASRHPIISSKNQSTGSYLGGKRGFLQCCLQNFEQIQFAVTHLDHLNENDRLKQIKQFQPNKNNIDILMGDLNALTRTDYSDKYYENIVQGQRIKSNWELPRFDLTNLLTNQWNYQDIFRIMNPELKDEQVVTCKYGTRIDYIYIQSKVLNKWNLTKCQIIDTKDATDHHLVLAEFQSK